MFRQEDPVIEKLSKSVFEFFCLLERGSLLSLFQLNSSLVTRSRKLWKRICPLVCTYDSICRISQFFGIENMVDISKPLMNMIRQECSESGPDPTGDFIERYKDRMASAPPSSTFHGSDGNLHMLGSVFDIFIAGTDTVSTFLEWAVHYMISYPDVQV